MTVFKIIEAEVKGDIYIEINSQYNNVKADKVIVAESIQARLYGTVNTLVIKLGAKVTLHGSVNGKTVNEGELTIY
jgi:hypothetical protein